MTSMREDSDTEANIPLGQENIPTVDPNTDQNRRYKWILSRFGIVEITLGIVSFIVCIASIIEIAPYNDALRASGLWCGVFLFVVGTIGICTGKFYTPCMLNANIVISIFTALTMAVQVFLSAYSAEPFAVLFNDVPQAVMHGILAFVGGVGLIVCIAHAVYCIRIICCETKQSNHEYSGTTHPPATSII